MDTDGGDWMGMDDEGMYEVDRMGEDSTDSETSTLKSVTRAMVILLGSLVVIFLLSWVMFG